MINEYLEKTKPEFLYGSVRDKLVCKDGFSISVQASEGHYCIPKDDNGPYTHVELGMPSKGDVSDIKKYYECGVYPRVPVEAVERLINKHCGIKT